MSSGSERKKQHRERKKQGITIPTCKHCSKTLRGKLSKERGLCSRCWKKTEQAKAETRDRVRRIREQKQQENNS